MKSEFESKMLYLRKIRQDIRRINKSHELNEDFLDDPVILSSFKKKQKNC